MLLKRTPGMWSEDIDVFEYSMELYSQMINSKNPRKTLHELDDNRLDLVLCHAILGLCTYADDISTMACTCADQEMNGQKIKP